MGSLIFGVVFASFGVALIVVGVAYRGESGLAILGGVVVVVGLIITLIGAKKYFVQEIIDELKKLSVTSDKSAT